MQCISCNYVECHIVINHDTPQYKDYGLVSILVLLDLSNALTGFITALSVIEIKRIASAFLIDVEKHLVPVFSGELEVLLGQLN